MGDQQEARPSSRLAVLVAVAAAMVGIIYGYDSSNIAGALDFIAKDFQITQDAEKGLLTSYVIFGMIGGALVGGALADRFGRQRMMVTIAATFAVFSLLSGLAWDVPSLAVARVLLGVTVGLSIVVVPLFVAESAPTRIRGALLVLYQVATVAGIILGYLVAWALAPAGSWRIMLGAAALPGAIITLLLLRAPDTPRWYMLKGRPEQAARVLARIDPGADVQAELAGIDRELRERAARGRGRGGGAGRSVLRQMVTAPYRRATVFVILLGFAVQITGINAIVYYSPQIFKAMGFAAEDHLAIYGLPALVQLAGLIAVFGSMVLVDRMGRRPVLLTGIGVMVAANALLIAIFALGGAGQGSGIGQAQGGASLHLSGGLVTLGFLGLVLFTVGFTFGFGALVWVYAGETFPSQLRGAGSSVMLTSDLVANLAIGLAFLPMLRFLGGAGTFAVLGGFAVLAFLLVLRFAPETKGRPLDDIRLFWENGGAWPRADASASSDAAGSR